MTLATLKCMDCFFGSFELPIRNELQKSAVVIFHIPELGIRFKAPFDGVDDDHNDFAALLALLEFIDSNQKYFKNKAYQIYGDNKKLINQLNQIEPLPSKFLSLFEKTRNYKKKYNISLFYIPQERNTALENLYD
jgi:hypothetical protein